MAKKLRFDPSANQYTNQLMNILGQMAMNEYQTEKQKQLWEWQQKRTKEMSQQNIQEMMTKFPQLFGNMGGGGMLPNAGGSPDRFSAKAIPGAYLKGLSSEGLPELGIFTPEQQREMGFQQDVGRFKAAGQEYATGKSIPMTLEGRDKFRAMPATDRASFIQARMANFPGASTAMKELRPQFAGKEFIQGESGKYREKPGLVGEQPIVDEEGNVIGYRPRGAVFKPKATEEKVTPDINLTNKVIGNIKTAEDLNELLKNKTAYKEAGVDIGTVVKSFFNTDLGKKNKGILQKILSWLSGG